MDGDGEVLGAANKYVIHFEKGGLPPLRERRVVDLALPGELLRAQCDRAPRDPLLDAAQVQRRRSLDVYIQAQSPGADKQANWLPTPPSGPFNLTVRIYQPKKEALDGTYKLPPVTKAR